MKLTVIGCGYLGATHAAAMAELGHQVLGMDTDADKVDALNKGQAPFVERGLDDLLAKHTAAGNLHFTASYAEAAAFADIHFLGVGTPQQDGSGAYDLTHLHTAVRRLAPRLGDGAVIVGKSTVPVGTVAQLRLTLDEHAPAGVSVGLAWSPEFLRESFAVEDTLRPDRIVLGIEDGDTRSEAVFRAVYADILAAGSPLIVTDMPTAELIKGAANAFLATKISFINAMAELCELTGADVQQLALALGYDQRIGAKGMRPGLGFGGGCLPKDLAGFTHRAEELGADQAATLLRQVDVINQRRREHTVELAREALGGTVIGKRIAVWGAAFKPGTDDIRDSPALAVADALHRAGAEVTVHDPAAMENARRAYPALDYADDLASAVTGAGLLLHLTDWSQYSDADPADLVRHIAVPRVIDARGSLDAERWRAAGWTFRALGRP
ncbi:UDP-glucose/GDP-mannose dehydrogenase family protein [Kitasatospora sp. MY 5-36]|uniref:UDP-glucose dehydrogenase family protein n=1 Tax=Kitasatospora sp. MY 5-36 TaxID=1678027 RepID=UPI0006714DC2|nr:UDP-glucose/GDP-mannose dehydrogenase family protein [Kitasatospora sp. MY 5-36]